MSAKIAIMLMGYPGIGKGTQAHLLAKRLGLYHIDTGKELYNLIKDPEAIKDDPYLLEQREIYISGGFPKYEWVGKVINAKVQELAQKGWGIVFSGSPRRPDEAEDLAKLLLDPDLYGRRRIWVFVFEASEETIVERVRNRLICVNDGCRYPTQKTRGLEKCPECGSGFKLKELGEDTIQKRFAEHRKLTLPAIEILKGFFPVYHINAEQTEEEILMAILDHLSPM